MEKLKNETLPQYPPTDNNNTDYSITQTTDDHSKNNSTPLLKSTTIVLEQGNYRIHVLGTAHVSEESAREERINFGEEALDSNLGIMSRKKFNSCRYQHFEKEAF